MSLVNSTAFSLPFPKGGCVFFFFLRCRDWCFGLGGVVGKGWKGAFLFTDDQSVFGKIFVETFRRRAVNVEEQRLCRGQDGRKGRHRRQEGLHLGRSIGSGDGVWWWRRMEDVVLVAQLRSTKYGVE